MSAQMAYHPKSKSVAAASVLLILLIIAFALFFSRLSVGQHQAYLTNGLDIGNVDQALWNTAQGRFLHFTLMAPVQSRLALHVEPILLFFVPFYWFGLGGPELLLVVQAVTVAFGAWAVFLIALDKFRETEPNSPLLPWVALIIAVAYLLLPTLQSAVLFDFHAVTLASTFLLFAFWALRMRKNWLYFLFVILAMASKEDMPLVVAMLGLYAGLAQKRWWLAAITIGISALWFVVAVFAIQPAFAAGGNIQLDRYAWLGNSPPEMLATMVAQPGLVFGHLWQQVDLPRYLFALFFPTGFLALLSPLTLLPMLPTLAVNLLSDNAFTWRLEDFHYGAPLAPFLFISAIYGISFVAKQSAKKSSRTKTFTIIVSLLASLLLIFSLPYHYHRGFTPLSRAFIWPEQTAHHQQLKAILSTIPSDTPVFAQSNLAPHLTHRQTIYTDFAYFTDPNFPATEPVQDIVLDVTSLENIGGLHQYLQQTLLQSGEYELITARDGILHFKPGSNSPNIALPPEFYTFTQPDALPQYSLPVNFGDVLRLHGYSLHFNRQEEVQVTAHLEALQPLTDVQPVLYLLDTQGQPLGATTDLQPVLAWHPMENWESGQQVQFRFNTLPWYTRDMPAYRLALGVISGSNVWNIEARHRPSVGQQSDIAPRLPANGTLVELAQIEQPWQMPHGGPQLRQYERPSMQNALQASFGSQIELFGYDTPKLDISQPEQARLSTTFYWQAVDIPEQLTRFVQLVGPDGQVYGQQDASPDNGNYPTYLWQSGEVVLDTVTFPVQASRPEGNYTLHVGFYAPDTGQRALLTTGEDHIEIQLP